MSMAPPRTNQDDGAPMVDALHAGIQKNLL
jgi:hypothetical protein